jgi:pimeloyl-ACP methyl ester carboxylesterase
MGSGERTVLFDAGGSDWSVVWALVQPEVARRARACAYDRAGLGHSDSGPAPRSPVAIVEDLHALVKAAGLQRPLVLVGHSLGGFNVKLYAALYPEDVAGLVLIDPSEERSWPRTRSWAIRRYGDRLAARSELLDQRFIGFLAQRYRECAEAAGTRGLDPDSPGYARCSDPVRPQLGPEVAAMRRKLQVSPAYQQAQASEIGSSVYADERSDQVYERLFRRHAFGSRPLVVLTHEEERSQEPLEELGREQGLRLHAETARLSRRGRHVTVAGSGHYIQLDKPEVVIAAIREVLDELERPAR